MLTLRPGALLLEHFGDHAQYHVVRSDSGPPPRARKLQSVTISVFLVDDHEVVRRGVRDLVEAEAGFVVVGEAGTAREALALLPAANPDVAVLDVRLPDGDGVELCRELRSRCERLTALMLTSFDDDQALMNAVMAGAAGYVLKQIRGTDLVDAIKQVAAGKSLLDPALTEQAFGRLRDISHDGSAPRDEFVGALTPQEARILDLIAEGCTNRQIAGQMFLSEKTVKNYVSSMLRKLGMRRRTEAAVFATRMAERRSSGGAAGGRHSPGSEFTAFSGP